MDVLKYCARCEHFYLNSRNQITCLLKQGKPDFKNHCEDFVPDPERVRIADVQEAERMKILAAAEKNQRKWLPGWKAFVLAFMFWIPVLVVAGIALNKLGLHYKSFHYLIIAGLYLVTVMVVEKQLKKRQLNRLSKIQD